MADFKSLVIGRGFMGRVHSEGLRRLGNVEVINPPSSEMAQHLSRKDIDAVHVCTPNSQHFPMAKAALEAGKHVLCEKPLSVTAAESEALVKLAASKGLRNCVCHNLRYYPMVQHMRRLREAGDLGDIHVVQGTYSQDWLLYDTDWNWRIDPGDAGPLRALADIGSHWCDMVEHVTGLRITELCADLFTLHETRKRPKVQVETFAGKTLRPEDYESFQVTTDDFASVLVRLGDRTRGAFTASQISSGCKNGLRIEIYGSKASVAWNQERPDELWIGHRNEPNQIIIKDPSLLMPGAQSYADLPGGHSEGYDDTFKQVFRRFYQSIADPKAAAEYPEFAAGLRQMRILEAELTSHKKRGWVGVE